MNPATDDIDALVARLLTEDSVQVGNCRLVRNRVGNFIWGTDPWETDAIAGLSASEEGCREAIAWAQRMNTSLPVSRILDGRPVNAQGTARPAIGR
jgi:hypothetical protein